MKKANGTYGTIKQVNIHIMEIPEGQEREKGAEGSFKEIKLKTSQILEGIMTPRFVKLKGPQASSTQRRLP